MKRWMAAASVFTLAAWGQGGVGGVRSGALYDAPAGAVRVVEGVAGSAHLGGAVLEGVGAAWVAPGGKAAVVRRGGVWALARGLGEDGIEEKELEQGVARARWSAGGRYVAVTGTDVIEVWDVEEMARVERVDLGEGREAASVAVSDPEGRPTRHAARGGVGVGGRGWAIVEIDHASPSSLPSDARRATAVAWCEAQACSSDSR